MGAGKIIGAVTQVLIAPLRFIHVNFSVWDYVPFNVSNVGDMAALQTLNASVGR